MGVSVHNNTLKEEVSKVIHKYAEEVARAVDRAAADLYMIDNYADTGKSIPCLRCILLIPVA